MYFLTEDDELIKKYYGVWNKVSNCIKKEFDKPIYNKKTLETKIKYYYDETTYFHGKEMPKVGLYQFCS